MHRHAFLDEITRSFTFLHRAGSPSFSSNRFKPTTHPLLHLCPCIACLWSFFDHPPVTHVIKGLQPLTNILSTGTPTVTVGKSSGSTYKSPCTFFVQISVDQAVKGLQTTTPTLSTGWPTEYVCNFIHPVENCPNPYAGWMYGFKRTVEPGLNVFWTTACSLWK